MDDEDDSNKNNNTTNDGIDALIDSDGESGADIFDDDDDDDGQVHSLSGTSMIGSAASMSPKSFKEVMDNITSIVGGGGGSSHSKIPSMIQHPDLGMTSTSALAGEESKTSLLGNSDRDEEQDDDRDAIADGSSSRKEELSTSAGAGTESDDADDDDDDKSGSESAEDYTDDEDEGSDGYKPGGYHPVSVGEVYNQRYDSSSAKKHWAITQL